MCFHGPFFRPHLINSSESVQAEREGGEAVRPLCSIHQFYSAQKHLSGVTLFRPLWRRQESEGLTSNEISTFSLSQISILKGLLHLFFEKGAAEAEVGGVEEGEELYLSNVERLPSKYQILSERRDQVFCASEK